MKHALKERHFFCLFYQDQVKKYGSPVYHIFFLHFLGKLGKGNVSYPKVQSMLLSWLLLSTYSETCIKRTSSGNAVVST